MSAKALMVLGTASGVGKSFLTAGLCRFLSNQGYRVAPFKAQNMSNNSYVTEEGAEIGRAQAVQAECARLKPSVHMNPVLLKPAADDGSQLVIQGKAVGHFKAREYFDYRPVVEKAVRDSYERLAAEYEIVVIEGAGSPAEVNLKKNDVVNFYTAEMADAKCLLVADIDRGGVFASLLGTLDLLSASERERIVGFVINKFRGDQSLFDDGIRFLEERSGKKVWGILPYDRSIWIEEEDSISNSLTSSKNLNGEEFRGLEIAVILLPRMSNFTDFEVLKHEPSVKLRYIRKAAEIGNPDLLILPGTKATIADYLYLLENGFRKPLEDYVAQGGRVLGICGGYQMLGDWILDEKGIESNASQIPGFGFLKMTTTFQPEKILSRIEENFSGFLFGEKIQGKIEAYEIHMGISQHQEAYASFGRCGVVHPGQRIAGTYYHGLFDSSSFRVSFLEALSKSAGKTLQEKQSFSVQEIKEIHYNKLASFIKQNLNLEYLQQLLDNQVSSL